MSNEQRHLYEFGPFRLDASERLLSRDGEPVSMPPKALETLIVLVRHQGRLVEKDELMRTLWPESFVEESNLNHHVWSLRKTLGEGHNGQRYIETVPRRGYRFVAEVTEPPEADDEVVLEKHTLTRIVTEETEDREIGEPEDAETRRRIAPLANLSVTPRPRISRLQLAVACLVFLGVGAILYYAWITRETRRAQAAVPHRSELRSIAVLPFKTIGAENDDSAYLGLGMTDALITRLGNSKRLIVRPTSAVRRYADPLQDPIVAGREQGVEAVLDGSIQRAGDRVRVTIQLLRAHDGASLWSATFDERFTDIFAVQDSISQQVMRELMIELNPEEAERLRRSGSKNAEAYQAYLKGLYFWNKRTKDNYQKAVQYFNHAIELDPTYAEAYVGLGNAYAYLGGHDRASQAEAISKQRAGSMKALELDDTLAEAHATLGLIAMNDEADWTKAEREFKRAIELSPNYATAHQWYGEFLADMGRFDEGIAEVKLAHELDPLSLTINTDVAKVYALARRYDEAIAQYKRALEMDPNFEVAHGLLALTYSMKGMNEEAVGELRKIENLDNDPMYLAFLAFAYGKAGKRVNAQRALGRMRELSKQTYVSSLWMALAYTGLGDKEQAFQSFDLVFDERAPGGTISLKVSYVWDSLRSDPRFAALERRAGF